MSDWRGNDKGGKKENAPPKKLPVIAPREKTTPSKKDWRSKSKSTPTSLAGTDRNWTGSNKQAIPKTFVLKKSATVGLLGLIIVGALATYIVWLLRENSKLPLIVSISTPYTGAKDLGENGYSKGVVAFISHLQKSKNIVPITSNDREMLLNEVAKNKEWLRNYSDIKKRDFVHRGIIRGGGPNKNVTAYYLSCYLVQTNVVSNGEWMLVSENDDPYKSSFNGLSIKTFFERIAEQTAPGSYSWIGLDAKMPTVVGNLKDLEFPAKSIEETFKSLSPALQQRLIVTLPCGGANEGGETTSYQESWMAPELSNSVFGHFFLKGVYTGFGKKEKLFTLDTFEKSLTNEIQRWVELRRFAVQRPAYLMSEETKRNKGKIKLFETAGGPNKDFKTERLSQEQITEKFKQLDGLWKNFEALRTAHRIAPLAYAEIEARLLQMEDLAECKDDKDASANYWPEILNETRAKIEQLRTQIESRRKVSLIEARSHSLLFPDLTNRQLDTILKESAAAGQSWLLDPNLWPWTPNNRSVATTRSRDDKCYLVWDVLQRIAQANDASGWSKAFSRKNIESALKYVETPEAGATEWLEIQLLKIIRDEVDFPEDDLKSSLVPEAIARTLATFSELQDISTTANHETSWWMDRQLVGRDEKFLLAFDLLIANQFEKCIQGNQSFKNDIDGLRGFRDELDLAMHSRDDTLQIAPHALASLMRLYRYRVDSKAAAGVEFQSHLEYVANRLGVAVSKALDIQQFLENHDTNSIAAHLKDRTDVDLVIMELERSFKELEGTEKQDLETIRNSRIALRWPRLPLEMRTKFHKNLVNYYCDFDPNDAVLSSKSLNSILDCRPCSDIGKAFLEPLKSSTDIDTFYSLVNGDLRIGIRDWSVDEPRSDGDPLRKDIYKTGNKVRILACSYGQRASAGKFPEQLWPWNSVSQFQSLCDANYETMNRKRILMARWGDGDLSDPSRKKFFFQRLAEQYRNSRDVVGDFAQAKRAMETSPMLLDQLNQVAAEEIKKIELELTADPTESIDTSIRKMSVDTSAPKISGIAALKIGRENRKPLTQNASERALPLRLDLENRKTKLTLSPEATESELFWSLRGHYRGTPFPPLAPKSIYSIAFDPTSLGPSTVQVSAKNSPPFTVFVLLDCSASMNDQDHKEARKTVAKLLEEFTKLELQGECPVRVALVPFGLVLNKNKTESEELSKIAAQQIGLNRWGDQVYYTELLDSSNFPKLQKILDAGEIRPRGLTPLYDAIVAACSLGADARSRIVVVSDGCNDVEQWYLPLDVKKGDEDNYMQYTGPRKSDTVVFDQLVSKKASLFIFQFTKGKLDAKEEQAILTLRSLLSRLAEKRLAKKNDRLVYPSFGEIQKEIVDSFPRSIVRVRRMDNGQIVGTGNFSEDIKIPYEGTPFWVTVGVESNGEKELVSEKLLITGNQKLELNHRSDLGELEFKSFDDIDTLENRKYTGGIKLEATKDASNRLFARPTGTADKLRFTVAIRGANEQKERKAFTVPPLFALMALRPSTNDFDVRNSFLIADYDYVPGTHYPILRFPVVPWKRTQTQTTKKADIDIWFANQIPADLGTRIKLKTIDTQTALDGIVQCDRTDSKLNVTVKPLQDDRIFVYFPYAKNSSRDFPDADAISDAREIHKFTLEPGLSSEVEVVLIKWSELKKAADLGLVNHHQCREQVVLR